VERRVKQDVFDEIEPVIELFSGLISLKYTEWFLGERVIR
jgi:hypothetical protein